jgi:pimeloyl-ACP methyl ester carboxylesterase
MSTVRLSGSFLGFLFLSILTAPAGCGGAGSPGDGATDGGADLQTALSWHPCDPANWPAEFPTPGSEVECTEVVAPAHHDQPGDGKTVTLRVARQKSKAFPSGKAVFQIAGGPGGSSVWQSGVIPKYLPTLLDAFDLVYVDQRGTGGSSYLGCMSGYPATEDEWIACASEHHGDDLDHVLTVDAADDLDFVRQRLGYDKIYLRGGSYGTRLGLEYLRRHDANVVAAVLDGLYPPDIDSYGESIPATDRGVARLVSDCNASASCKAAVPDLLTDLQTRRAALKASPRPISIGGQADVEDETTFLQALEFSVYDAYYYFRVPRAIHAALAGDNSGWNAILSDGFGAKVTDGASDPPPRRAPLRIKRRFPGHGLDYVAPGTFETVECAEYVPNSMGIDALKAIAAKTTWGAGTYVDRADACKAWSVMPVSAALRTAVTSSAKVLLLNGDLDLNTFPEWGARAAKTLPNSASLTIPYATHSTMSIPCVGTIIGAFLAADGAMGMVDTSCVAALPQPAW